MEILGNSLRPHQVRGGWATAFLCCAIAVALSACAPGVQSGKSIAAKASPVGAATSAVITPAGGELSIRDVVDIEFPAGMFLVDQMVSVDIIEDTRLRGLFVESTSLSGVTRSLPYKIRIATGNQQPIGRVKVRIPLPPAFRDSLAPDSWVRLYGYTLVDEAGMQMEMFEHCGGRFRPVEGVVDVPLSPIFFSTDLGEDGTYQAVLTLGVTPEPGAAK